MPPQTDFEQMSRLRAYTRPYSFGLLLAMWPV
jgi:hypothetical protein